MFNEVTVILTASVEIMSGDTSLATADLPQVSLPIQLDVSGLVNTTVKDLTEKIMTEVYDMFGVTPPEPAAAVAAVAPSDATAAASADATAAVDPTVAADAEATTAAPFPEPGVDPNAGTDPQAVTTPDGTDPAAAPAPATDSATIA